MNSRDREIRMRTGHKGQNYMLSRVTRAIEWVYHRFNCCSNRCLFERLCMKGRKGRPIASGGFIFKILCGRRESVIMLVVHETLEICQCQSFRQNQYQHLLPESRQAEQQVKKFGCISGGSVRPKTQCDKSRAHRALSESLAYQSITNKTGPWLMAATKRQRLCSLERIAHT